MKLNFENINCVFIPKRPDDKGLIGFCNFTIDDHLALNGIAVYTNRNGIGYRLVYPLNKYALNEQFYFVPISKELGNILTESINDKITDIMANKEN